MRDHRLFKIKKQVLMALCFFFVIFLQKEVWAASSPIKNIRVNIYSRLESGDPPGIIKIDGTDAEKHEVTAKAKSDLFTVTKAEWAGREVPYVSVGDELRVMLVLSPTDVSSYYFLAAYQAGTFHIEGGSYISSKREGDDLILTVKIRAVRGKYDSPLSVEWNEKTLGQAFWKPGQVDSKIYHVQLFRNGTRILELNKLYGNQYNFYPYMTRPGNYKLKVQTVIKDESEKKYAGNSEYTESSDLTIDDRDVSDGKGREGDKVVGGTAKKIGWDKEGDADIYRMPSGELLTGWGHIGGYWYYFHPDGKMVRGWEKVNNKWYFLNLNGTMAVGWIKDNKEWYYLLPGTEVKYGHLAG